MKMFLVISMVLIIVSCGNKPPWITYFSNDKTESLTTEHKDATYDYIDKQITDQTLWCDFVYNNDKVRIVMTISPYPNSARYESQRVIHCQDTQLLDFIVEAIENKRIEGYEEVSPIERDGLFRLVYVNPFLFGHDTLKDNLMSYIHENYMFDRSSSLWQFY